MYKRCVTTNITESAILQLCTIKTIVMITTIVYVSVKQANIEDFIAASEENHEHSIKEKGNMRFDFLQQADDPAQFVLYEAYEDEASAAAHKETAHYKEWRARVADWMAEPRKGVRYQGIKP
ncbi:antibiotic biosynthesis monooxygenase [Bacteroidota bacterium]